MACFVSLSFSIPLCSLQNPLKGRYPKKSAFCKLPGMATTKTASYFLALCISNKGICSVSDEHHLTTRAKHFDEIDSCSLNELGLTIAASYLYSPRSVIEGKKRLNLFFALTSIEARHIAICNDVALTYAKLLKLTWTIMILLPSVLENGRTKRNYNARLL